MSGFGVQRVILITVELAVCQVESQQFVQGGGLATGDFGHAPGGPAGGGGQQVLPACGFKYRRDGPDQGGFARTRPAGDDHDSMGQYAFEHRQLGIGELDGQTFDDSGHDPVVVHCRGG